MVSKHLFASLIRKLIISQMNTLTEGQEMIQSFTLSQRESFLTNMLMMMKQHAKKMKLILTM